MKKANFTDKVAEPKDKPKPGSYEAVVAAVLSAEKKGITFQIVKDYEESIARHERAD